MFSFRYDFVEMKASPEKEKIPRDVVRFSQNGKRGINIGHRETEKEAAQSQEVP